jgi:hypothetical protein
MISILCTSRSGSTNLTNFIANCIEKPAVYSPFLTDSTSGIDSLIEGNLYKLLIHNQPTDYNHLFNYGDAIITRSKMTILLDRKNKREQAESLVFRKQKYHTQFDKYHLQEYYDEKYLDEKTISDAISHYLEHTRAINQLSDKYSLPIWYYEDIFSYDDTNIKKLCEYYNIPYNETYYQRYISPVYKERLKEKNEKFI